jgi:hypothetical protein
LPFAEASATITPRQLIAAPSDSSPRRCRACDARSIGQPGAWRGSASQPRTTGGILRPTRLVPQPSDGSLTSRDLDGQNLRTVKTYGHMLFEYVCNIFRRNASLQLRGILHPSRRRSRSAHSDQPYKLIRLGDASETSRQILASAWNTAASAMLTAITIQKRNPLPASLKDNRSSAADDDSSS